MKIIFLDFDGVMDTVEYCHFLESMGMPICDRQGTIFDSHSVFNLKRIIDATGAVVVITSDWKYLMSYKDIIEMWEERDLPGCVIDVTPNCKKRGDEIDVWLSECKEECQYVIIDDMWAENFNEHQVSHLVVTNPYYGIEDDTAERAIKILNKPLC